jgi:uncharacterized protein YllA (UPF0747 family)
MSETDERISRLIRVNERIAVQLERITHTMQLTRMIARIESRMDELDQHLTSYERRMLILDRETDVLIKKLKDASESHGR